MPHAPLLANENPGPHRTARAPLRMRRLGRAALVGASLVVGACAGSTKKTDPAESALGNLPGRWENAFVEIETETGPLRMHYVVAGPKDAPRLILLHGFPDFAYTWHDVLPQLARDYRVLAPDMRGYAATGKPRKGYDLDTLAADILAFTEATAAVDGAPADRPTHLLGHDWGAAVGWWAVLKKPTRYTSYTAISVAHPRAFTEYLEKSEKQRKRSRYMRKLTLPGVPLLIAGMSDKRRRGIYRDELVRKDAFGDNELVWYRAAFDSTMETRPPIRYYKERFHRAEENEAFARKRPKIPIPVLVLWGQKDSVLMWEMAADSCKYVEPGKCTTHVFPTAGHWVHWDDPSGVVERWRAFAGTAPSGAAASPSTGPAANQPAAALPPVQ